MSDKRDEYGYVKFTGDYSKLKSMGFTFQKLYANNYMQWERNGFRVWKKGGDITHDDHKLFKLVRFLQTNPEVGETKFPNGKICFVFYKIYYSTEFNQYNYDYHPYDEEHKQLFKDYYQTVHEHCEDVSKPMPEPIGDTVYVNKNDMDVLKEFKELGWYELDYYPNECDCEDCSK